MSEFDVYSAIASGWQSMEIAPKDGTRILVLAEDGKQMEVAHWYSEGDSWADENGNPCTAGLGTIQVTGSWFSGAGWFQPNEIIAWHWLPPLPDSKEGES